MKFLFGLTSLLLLNACAMSGTSIRDVPRVDSQKIQVPAMSALPQRDLSLSIVDARSNEVRDQSTELRVEIERSTTEALQRTGINVKPSSNNTLVLTIQDFQTSKFKEGCVKITGSLTIPQKAKLGSEANSCFEMKSPLGFKMSSDITQAYEESLSAVFRNLDEAMGKMQTR